MTRVVRITPPRTIYRRGERPRERQWIITLIRTLDHGRYYVLNEVEASSLRSAVRCFRIACSELWWP